MRPDKNGTDCTRAVTNQIGSHCYLCAKRFENSHEGLNVLSQSTLSNPDPCSSSPRSLAAKSFTAIKSRVGWGWGVVFSGNCLSSLRLWALQNYIKAEQDAVSYPGHSYVMVGHAKIHKSLKHTCHTLPSTR